MTKKTFYCVSPPLKSFILNQIKSELDTCFHFHSELFESTTNRVSWGHRHWWTPHPVLPTTWKPWGPVYYCLTHWQFFLCTIVQMRVGNCSFSFVSLFVFTKSKTWCKGTVCQWMDQQQSIFVLFQVVLQNHFKNQGGCSSHQL